MIKLFSDTCANLPVALTAKYGIKILAFNYSVNGEPVPYYEGIDFDGKTFYEAMRNGADVQTSLVSTGDFETAFEEAAKNGDDFLYVGMSGGVSGTFNSSRLAKEEVLERYPNVKGETIDSYGAGLGLGLLVLEAAKCIEQGKSFEETVEHVLTRRATMAQYFTVDDLKYLKKTGRVSATTAFIGNVLSIKPILVGDETGHIIVIDKVKGSKTALKTLIEKYDELVKDRSDIVAINHCDNEEAVNYLIEKLKEKGCTGEILTAMFEPVDGSHLGPGSVALFFNGISK